jgi:hypothetical protein
MAVQFRVSEGILRGVLGAAGIVWTESQQEPLGVVMDECGVLLSQRADPE